MPMFQGPIMEFNLLPQSPMIHFQSYQTGATLRASEVKPKLDKYLIRWAHLSEEDGIFINPEKTALNYKLAIVDNRQVNIMSLENYKLYFGNIGSDEENKGIYSSPTVSIICFNQKLKKVIEENISIFFLTHNFGTRQNKGFGSFICEDDVHENNSNKIALALMKVTKSDVCYIIEPDNTDVKRPSSPNGQANAESMTQYYIRLEKYNEKQFEIIEKFYTKFIKKVSNENKWLKEKFGKKKKEKGKSGKNNREEQSTPFFVKGLLGTGNQMLIDEDKIIQIKNDDIERVPSPILFKVVKNQIFVCIKPVDERLLGQEFTFIVPGKKESLRTPNNFHTDKKFDDFIKTKKLKKDLGAKIKEVRANVGN